MWHIPNKSFVQHNIIGKTLKLWKRDAARWPLAQYSRSLTNDEAICFQIKILGLTHILLAHRYPRHCQTPSHYVNHTLLTPRWAQRNSSILPHIVVYIRNSSSSLERERAEYLFLLFFCQKDNYKSVLCIPKRINVVISEFWFFPFEIYGSYLRPIVKSSHETVYVSLLIYIDVVYS